MSDLELPEPTPLSNLLREIADQIRDPEIENERIADDLERVAAIAGAPPGVGWCTISIPYAPLYVENTTDGLRYTCGHSPSHHRSLP